MERKQQVTSVPHGHKELCLAVTMLLSVTVVLSGCHRATLPPSRSAATDPTASRPASRKGAADPTASIDYEVAEKDKDELDRAVQKKEQGESPTGWYYIEETTWIPAVDTLGRSLQKARRDIAENHLDAAAANVRRGTSFLMDEMGKVAGASQKRLEDTIARLNRIALALEAGRLDKAGIDKAFAAAHRADVQDRWVSATTEEWVPLLDQPDVHLNRARDLFLSKALDDAALELRKAVAYMEIENSRVPGEAKGGLDKPIEALKALAEEVEKGAVDDVAELDDVFTRIDYALAKHHYLSSVSHWERLDQAATGYSMKAAAQYLEHAVERTKTNAAETTDAVVQKTMAIAEGLIEDTGAASKDTGKQLAKMGQVIIEMGGE